MKAQEATLFKRETLLKVLKDPVQEFELILGHDGRPRIGRPASQGLRNLEEVFNEMEDLEIQPLVPVKKAELPPCQVISETTRQKRSSESLAFPRIHHPKNPLVVWTVRDLFSLCGPIVSAFVLLQAGSAIVLARLMDQWLEMDRYLLSGVILLASFLFDSTVFAFFRGRIYTDLRKPLTWVGMLTIAPGILAYLWLRVQSAG